MHWYTFYSFKVAILAFQLYEQKRKTTFKPETGMHTSKRIIPSDMRTPHRSCPRGIVRYFTNRTTTKCFIFGCTSTEILNHNAACSLHITQKRWLHIFLSIEHQLTHLGKNENSKTRRCNFLLMFQHCSRQAFIVSSIGNSVWAGKVIQKNPKKLQYRYWWFVKLVLLDPKYGFNRGV